MVTELTLGEDVVPEHRRSGKATLDALSVEFARLFSTAISARVAHVSSSISTGGSSNRGKAGATDSAVASMLADCDAIARMVPLLGSSNGTGTGSSASTVPTVLVGALLDLLVQVGSRGDTGATDRAAAALATVLVGGQTANRASPEHLDTALAAAACARPEHPDGALATAACAGAVANPTGASVPPGLTPDTDGGGCFSSLWMLAQLLRASDVAPPTLTPAALPLRMAAPLTLPARVSLCWGLLTLPSAHALLRQPLLPPPPAPAAASTWIRDPSPNDSKCRGWQRWRRP
jgi:hypothetical protein